MGWLLVVIGIFGVLGGGSGWFCAGFECFWGGCELVFSCYQWLWVVICGYWLLLVVKGVFY